MQTTSGWIIGVPVAGLPPVGSVPAATIPMRIRARWWRHLALTMLPLVALLPALARPAAAAVFLTGNYIQLPIDNSTQPGRFMAEGNASGAKYNSAGTGGASGRDFWQPGVPVYNYTIAVNGSIKVNGTSWAVAPTVTDASSGSTHSATITGRPFTGLTFTRLVSFGDNSQFITITDTLTNSSGSSLTQVATLDNTDPDQDSPPTPSTNNDVVSAQVTNDFAVASGPATGLSLGFGSPSSLRVVDCSGFSNTDPYSIIASPSDPDGAEEDIGLDIAINYGTLADGESKAVTWYMVFSPSKADAIATYAQATGCGDGVVGLGEQCDDGNTTSGDGCSAACQVEPCYTCSGQPSTCSPLPDGSDCDDGVFCNGTDTCSAATCTIHGGNPCTGATDCTNVCDELNDACLASAPFGTPCTDDGNVCTIDQCDGMGACVHPDNDFGFCDDGVFCNGSDSCFGGICAFHDGDPCVFDECNTACDEMTDTCDPSMAGVPCSDDGSECTNDQCDGMGSCAHPPLLSGTSCADDGLVCTNDQCDGMGFCAHPPVAGGTSCPDDGNVCTNDICDGIGLCVHPARPDGIACDDANACTQTDLCHSGHCVGADPVICTAPACHEPGTCDPETGACTDCPAGYTPGEGGCQKTYVINGPSLDNLLSSCDGTGDNRESDCINPFGFHWTDTGDAGVGDVTRVDVQFTPGIDCAHVTRPVTLNGEFIGLYASTAAASCSCSPPVTTLLLPDVNKVTYSKGGFNAVVILAGRCAGLSTDATGEFAVVTVTYADLGAPVVMQSGCRQASESKFQYFNHATDARDKIQWKWARGAATTQADLSDPTTSADYQFCVYAETSGAPALLIGAEVPASASLWSAVRDVGYQYADKTASHDGMRQILVKGGAAGKSKIILKGKGAALSDPALPLPPANGIRVQLTNESSAVCWESEFPVSALTGGNKGKTP